MADRAFIAALEIAQAHCIRALHALRAVTTARDASAVYHGIVVAIDEMDEADRAIHLLPDAALPEPIPSLEEFVAAHSRVLAAGAR